ncbi:hypothetical protein BH780_gp100 [Bacillus phage Eldridge]|uniref:Uncharacterized protein n=1 Tax=Bacillus phage Eldridge TaxID=1776293 RepID=A0A109QIT6_9CAUD|nr:hypothetical protein BH780_gp100 [Bacillus phage Eldridge]AMB18683.1 hypothetical protein Eldridge_0103 [Bacillus phage Eldridge]
MELVVHCESHIDQCRIVYELVGDDFSFTFDAKTGKVHIPVESKEKAQHEVSRRLPLYDLEEAYICEYIEEGKEPEELTAY